MRPSNVLDINRDGRSFESMERKSNYQVFRRRGGVRSKYFDDRDQLISHYASTGDPVGRIYSKKQHGYLGNGETRDGFKREIELRREIIRLEMELQKLSNQQKS